MDTRERLRELEDLMQKLAAMVSETERELAGNESEIRRLVTEE